jgi:hypothetical protein
MNARLVARATAGTWRVRVEPAPEPLDAAERAALDAAQARGRAVAWDAYAALAGASEAWQLEWGKAPLGEGEVALGFAVQVADACLQARSEEIIAVRAPAACLSRAATERALRARGLRVDGGDGFAAAAFVLACGAALLAWLGTLLRTFGEAMPLPAAPLALAVHGEDATRTRHVLALLRERPQAPVLVLGRPRASAATHAADFARQAGLASVQVSRPFDLRAAGASLPRALALLAEGARLAAAAPWRPPFALQAGMAYRVLWGAAAARWWERTRPAIAVVAYGHTGLADGTLLERAQQAAGARTVHAVHGVSAGLNFAGRSSLAVLRCAHDAGWHARLGGYGATRSARAARPALRPATGPVVVMTNLAHPMNLHWRAAGVVAEVEALQAVADALDAAGDAATRYWQPHPALARLPAADRDALAAAAVRLGFAALAPGTLAPDAPRRVVCTPSTVALELLAAGHLPVVLAPQPPDPASALAHWPLLATDAATLTSAWRELGDPAAATTAWAAAWERIGPAPPLAAADLEPRDGSDA